MERGGADTMVTVIKVLRPAESNLPVVGVQPTVTEGVTTKETSGARPGLCAEGGIGEEGAA